MEKYQLFIISCFLLVSCTFSSISKKIYSDPDWNETPSLDNINRLVVISSNNFQDSIRPQIESIYISETKQNLSLKVGGAEIISAYIDILRNRYKNQLLILDSGNLFQKSTLRSQQLTTLKFYNYIKYDAVAFSTKEVIDINLLNKYLEKWPVDFINSNILSLKTGNLLQGKHLLPYKVITVNDIKIGIVGLSPAPKTTDFNLYKGIYFEDPVLAFLKTRKKLQEQNIELTILLSGIKTKCISDNPQFKKKYTNEVSFQLNCPQQSDEMINIINRLPPNAVDLIITSNSNYANGFIKDIPVMQNPGLGQYISRIELFYDKENKKVLKNMTLVHPPIKLCHQFFEATDDCHLGKELPSLDIPGIIRSDRVHKLENTNTVPAKFLGQTIFIDKKVSDLLNL